MEEKKPIKPVLTPLHVLTSTLDWIWIEIGYKPSKTTNLG